MLPFAKRPRFEKEEAKPRSTEWNWSVLKNMAVSKVTIYATPEKKDGGKSKEENLSVGEREGKEREEKEKKQNEGERIETIAGDKKQEEKGERERKEKVAGKKVKQVEKGEGERKDILSGERREEVSGEKVEKKKEGERKEEKMEEEKVWARYRDRSMVVVMQMQKNKEEDKCLDNGLHASVAEGEREWEKREKKEKEQNEGERKEKVAGEKEKQEEKEKGERKEIVLGDRREEVSGEKVEKKKKREKKEEKMEEEKVWARYRDRSMAVAMWVQKNKEKDKCLDSGLHASVAAGEREGEKIREKEKEQNEGEGKEKVAGEKEKQEEKGGERKKKVSGGRREEVSGEKVEKKNEGEGKEEHMEEERALAKSNAISRARYMARTMWMQKNEEDKCLDSGLHASEIKPNEGVVHNIVTQQEGYIAEVEMEEERARARYKAMFKDRRMDRAVWMQKNKEEKCLDSGLHASEIKPNEGDTAVCVKGVVCDIVTQQEGYIAEVEMEEEGSRARYKAMFRDRPMDRAMWMQKSKKDKCLDSGLHASEIKPNEGDTAVCVKGVVCDIVTQQEGYIAEVEMEEEGSRARYKAMFRDRPMDRAMWMQKSKKDKCLDSGLHASEIKPNESDTAVCVEGVVCDIVTQQEGYIAEVEMEEERARARYKAMFRDRPMDRAVWMQKNKKDKCLDSGLHASEIKPNESDTAVCVEGVVCDIVTQQEGYIAEVEMEEERARARYKAMFRDRPMDRAVWMQKNKEDKCLDSGLHASEIKPNEGDTAVCVEGVVCDIVTQQEGYIAEVEMEEEGSRARYKAMFRDRPMDRAMWMQKSKKDKCLDSGLHASEIKPNEGDTAVCVEGMVRDIVTQQNGHNPEEEVVEPSNAPRHINDQATSPNVLGDIIPAAVQTNLHQQLEPGLPPLQLDWDLWGRDSGECVIAVLYLHFSVMWIKNLSKRY